MHIAGTNEEASVYGLSSKGQVTLNAEGKQYIASFHLGMGVITVTSGCVSRVMLLGEAVVSPESVARTILKRMVRENGPDTSMVCALRTETYRRPNPPRNSAGQTP
ncbi:MAG: hypothetical protein M3023_02180 [Pseudomonadota bacterium]|nr:hypothetical protein [Pseudomonadota bacterium]